MAIIQKFPYELNEADRWMARRCRLSSVRFTVDLAGHIMYAVFHQDLATNDAPAGPVLRNASKGMRL